MPISLVAIENGDHALIKIGNDTDAVLCDPWTRMIYPAYLYEEILQNFKSEIVDGVPLLEDFDVRKHRLVERLSSEGIFPEVPEAVSKKLPDLQKMLDQVENCKGSQEKVKLAEKTLRMIQPIGLGFENSMRYAYLSNIVAQLRYLVHGNLSDPFSKPLLSESPSSKEEV